MVILAHVLEKVIETLDMADNALQSHPDPGEYIGDKYFKAIIQIRETRALLRPYAESTQQDNLYKLVHITDGMQLPKGSICLGLPDGIYALTPCQPLQHEDEK